MRLVVSHHKALLVSSALFAGLILFTGCSPKEPEATTAPPKPGGPQMASAAPTGDPGKDAFNNNCMRCHKLDGKGGGMGPDLSHTGAEASHTEEWLTDFIKNPSSKKPGSRMPAFEGKIKDDDLKALSKYLASLK